MTDDDPDGESNRQARGRLRRDAGEESARLAKTLMELPESAIDKLGLDDDLREAVARARGVTSKIARRRAERGLSGDLRRTEIEGLESRIAAVVATGAAVPRLFKLSESWRERLIDEGEAAAATFPGGSQPELLSLIHQARRERDTGRPPGAARALFRYIHAALESELSAAATGSDEPPTS